MRRFSGAAARLSGRKAEVLAALYLMLKGYRILGFRLRTPHGEIDLVALRGPILAVVEVKRRLTLEAALEAVSHGQRQRLRRAGLYERGITTGSVSKALGLNRRELYRRAGLTDAVVRLDLIALAPRRWPRHIVDAWSSDEQRP